MKTVKITSQFGHEIMAVNFAKAFGFQVVILPEKETKEEFEAESEKIFRNMSFFYKGVTKVAFEDRGNFSDAWDVVESLKAKKLDACQWLCFAATRLEPQLSDEELPKFEGLQGKSNILIIPQKLVSDGKCGVTAAQQSLPLEVFDFLKERSENLVLGQHFHKVNDLEKVQSLAQAFGMYVPGMTENKEVFGIRGVQHKMYYNMYASLKGSVGIAGTHTWLLLTLFPEIPQIILFNKQGIERWKEIEAAYQERGFRIHCIGFDEETNLENLSREIEEKYKLLFG